MSNTEGLATTSGNPQYAFRTFKIPYTKRELAEALGIDYDDMLRYEQERAKLDPEVLDAMADEVQRRMLGLS